MDHVAKQTVRRRGVPINRPGLLVLDGVLFEGWRPRVWVAP